MASGGKSSGDLFGWREPVLAARPGGTARRGGHPLAEDGARIVLASDQAPRLAEILDEAGHPVAVVERIEEPPPPGAIALVGRSLNGGFVRRAGRPGVRHGPRAVRHRPSPPAEGASTGRAARHPRAADAG